MLTIQIYVFFIIVASITQTLSVVLALVGKAGAAMAFTDIYVYTSEVVPTEVRNIGMGTSSVCARISGMAAPYVGGLLVLLVWIFEKVKKHKFPLSIRFLGQSTREQHCMFADMRKDTEWRTPKIGNKHPGTYAIFV